MGKRTITQQVEEILSRPGEQLSRSTRFVRFQFDLWAYCARRLHQNNLMAMSAALSFRTIFAMIPILVLGFLVLESVGVVENGKRTMRDFLDASGFAQIVVPESTASVGKNGVDVETATNPMDQVGEERVINVADQIEQLVADVEGKMTFERIGPVGALILIWTALTLFNTIEQSLNRIFEAPRSRAIARRVLLFWSVLTLGPVVILAVTYFSRLGVEACQGVSAIASLTAVLGWAVPVLVGMVVIAMAYKLIPNTHVKFTAAFGGAVITVPLWLATRGAFSVYVERFVLKGNLYGVLGVLPLFMLWLNLSWSVFLFGAQLAHTATNLRQFRQAKRAERRPLAPSDWLAVMLAIARPFARGHGAARFDKIAEETDLSPESLRRLLDRLVQSGFVCVTNEQTEPGYLTVRPHDQVRLVEILDCADPHRQPEADRESSVRATVTATLDRSRAVLEQDTLAHLVIAEDLEELDPPNEPRAPSDMTDPTETDSTPSR